ncbi:MAG: hypothetical protein ACPGU7_14220 [Gammaproteobacteria bacterium]
MTQQPQCRSHPLLWLSVWFYALSTPLLAVFWWPWGGIIGVACWVVLAVRGYQLFKETLC